MNNINSFRIMDPVHPYAWQPHLFSEDECKKIIELGKQLEPIKARVGELKNEELQYIEELEVRNSEVTWLYPTHDREWIYQRILSSVLNLNDQFFQFDIAGSIEELQFTSYKAPAAFYAPHTDRCYNTQIRKLSVTVQLSDPKDYTGGELRLHEATAPTIMGKSQGQLAVFPSFITHEVTKVTQGERCSLVCWITGNSFK
jgi:PKHD-type hydroxylase